MCPSSGETTVFIHSRPKHAEKRNKHTKNNCAPNWLYLHDYTGMDGQENIKKTWFHHLHDYTVHQYYQPLY